MKYCFCSESGICFETACVPNNAKVSKPRQKHEIPRIYGNLKGQHGPKLLAVKSLHQFSF